MSVLVVNVDTPNQNASWFFLVVTLLCLSSCASRIEIVDLYENSAYIGRNYERVLVIDISSSIDERERFESLLADSIRAKGSDAIPSYTIIGLKAPLNGPSITKAVDETGADAVLVTHLSSVKGEPSLKEGRVEVDKTCRQGSLYESFLYDYTEVDIPEEAGISHTASVVANLYDAKDNVRIWAVQSTCFARETWADVLADQTNSIAGELRHNRFLRE